MGFYLASKNFQLYELELRYFQGVATPEIYAMIPVRLRKTALSYLFYVFHLP